MMPIETTTTRPPATWRTYHRLTRSATYSFLAALPLLVLYEVLIVFANRGQLRQVRVGADVWMKQALAALGGTGLLVLGLVVLAVGVGIFFYERRKRLPLYPRYLVWMVAESAVYAVVVAGLVSGFVGLLFAFAPALWPLLQAAATPDLTTRLALSLGAGLYEELFFRVLLVGGLYALLRRVVAQRGHAYVAAALIGALLFSAVHYTGPFGDAFTLASFTFRFLFGLVLNALFLCRGFGVAAWTHALYDVMVVTHLLG